MGSSEVVKPLPFDEFCLQVDVAVVAEELVELLLVGTVRAFDFPVIRYVIYGASFVPLFFFERRYGEPILDVGRRKHEGAGRPSIDRGLRARARYMARPSRLCRMRYECGSVGVVLPASARPAFSIICGNVIPWD